MLQIDVNVTGNDQVNERLNELALLDTEKLLDRAVAIVLNRNRDRFLDQVSPDLIPWKPSFGAMRRATRGEGGGTLFDTGNLFRSIQEFDAGVNKRLIGTDVEYGVKHQFGLEGMVKREFLGVNEQDSLIVERFLIKQLEKRL